jgi:hypothetical protein
MSAQVLHWPEAHYRARNTMKRKEKGAKKEDKEVGPGEGQVPLIPSRGYAGHQTRNVGCQSQEGRLHRSQRWCTDANENGFSRSPDLSGITCERELL